MNVKILSLSVVTALAILSAPAYAITESEQAKIKSDIAKLVADHPSLVAGVTASLAAAATNEEQELILQSAMEAAPDQAAAIARAARRAGVSPETITTVAITVPGVDPALVSEASAAGPASSGGASSSVGAASSAEPAAVDTPTRPNPPGRGSSVSPS